MAWARNLRPREELSVSFTQVRTGFAVAPILEETAHRYGFFGGWTSGGHYRISQQGLEGLVLFGQPLCLKHFTQRFSLASERHVELEFPSQVASFDSWCQWRDEFREFLQVLAEENPGKLGRNGSSGDGPGAGGRGGEGGDGGAAR